MSTIESRITILPLNRRRFKVLLNPHFWGIIFIMLFLAYAYYANLSMFDHYFSRWSWIWGLIVFEFNYGLNGILFCFPIIYASVIFGWQGTLFAWIATMVLMLPRIYYLAYNSTTLFTNIFCLLVPLLFMLILTIQNHWRQSIKESAMEREKERQAYIALILKAQEDERKRISREIHDDTIQRLWVVTNQIQSLIDDNGQVINHGMKANLTLIKDQIVQISDDAKKLSLALRPGILDNLGLIPALRYLVDELNKTEIVSVSILIEGTQRTLSSEVNTHIYRISQEALNNIRRHSQATQASLTLSFGIGSIRLEIWDNGKGLHLNDLSKLSGDNKLGLIGIQERVRLLGGVLRFKNNSTEGTTLSIEFPD